LSLVSRLEEFPANKIERSAGRDVVQYRGQIMPLVHVSEVLGLTSSILPDPVQVIVYSEGGRCVGLVVDEIVDIADQDVEVSRDHCSDGILGTAIIQQHVTDLFNVHALLLGGTSTMKGVSA
jgi:two-component system, chemotaxis family, sensor kinase CheA